MRKFVSLLLAASLVYTSPASADDEFYENLNPLEYSIQELGGEGEEYTSYPVTNFKTYYRQNPHEVSERIPGTCYYNCSRAACLTVGVALGVAIIIAMVAIVFKDGNSAHCHDSHCHH